LLNVSTLKIIISSVLGKVKSWGLWY